MFEKDEQQNNELAEIIGEMFKIILHAAIRIICTSLWCIAMYVLFGKATAIVFALILSAIFVVKPVILALFMVCTLAITPIVLISSAFINWVSNRGKA